MPEDNPVIVILTQLIKLLDNTWVKQAVKKAWNLFQKLLFRSDDQGMYEVLDYETILELCDPEGKEARVIKTEKVWYLQNDVIAFQDQAWGEAKFFYIIAAPPELRLTGTAGDINITF
jgi:hypothetical protein